MEQRNLNDSQQQKKRLISEIDENSSSFNIKLKKSKILDNDQLATVDNSKIHTSISSEIEGNFSNGEDVRSDLNNHGQAQRIINGKEITSSQTTEFDNMQLMENFTAENQTNLKQEKINSELIKDNYKMLEKSQNINRSMNISSLTAETNNITQVAQHNHISVFVSVYPTTTMGGDNKVSQIENKDKDLILKLPSIPLILKKEALEESIGSLLPISNEDLNHNNNDQEINYNNQAYTHIDIDFETEDQKIRSDIINKYLTEYPRKTLNEFLETKCNHHEAWKKYLINNRANFFKANLSNKRLNRSDFSNVDFREAKFVNSKMRYVKLTSTLFDKADITNAQYLRSKQLAEAVFNTLIYSAKDEEKIIKAIGIKLKNDEKILGGLSENLEATNNNLEKYDNGDDFLINSSNQEKNHIRFLLNDDKIFELDQVNRILHNKTYNV